MSKRKYLDDLSYETLEEQTSDAKRKTKKRWEKEREKYGFDERDTWNLDTTMVELLYERIMMFMAVNNVNLDFHTIEVNGKSDTLHNWLIKLIQLCTSYLTCEEFESVESFQMTKEIWTIWSGVDTYVWW